MVGWVMRDGKWLRAASIEAWLVEHADSPASWWSNTFSCAAPCSRLLLSSKRFRKWRVRILR
jgi:hypothetical protein